MKFINKKLITNLFALFLLSIIVLPSFVMSQGTAENPGPRLPTAIDTTSPLPLYNTEEDYARNLQVTPKIDNGFQIITCDQCDYDDFVETINRIVNWVIASAGVIFTISAIWGGFLYMTSGVNPGNKAKAKNILYSTVIGFIIVLCSWLIVYTIITILVDNKNSDIFRFIGN